MNTKTIIVRVNDDFVTKTNYMGLNRDFANVEHANNINITIFGVHFQFPKELLPRVYDALRGLQLDMDAMFKEYQDYKQGRY